MPARRFPPPWTVEELEACFVVKDSAGQKLAYVYFEADTAGGVPDIGAATGMGGDKLTGSSEPPPRVL
jgi:hypothetical protein